LNPKEDREKKKEREMEQKTGKREIK